MTISFKEDMTNNQLLMRFCTVKLVGLAVFLLTFGGYWLQKKQILNKTSAPRLMLSRLVQGEIRQNKPRCLSSQCFSSEETNMVGGAPWKLISFHFIRNERFFCTGIDYQKKLHIQTSDRIYLSGPRRKRITNMGRHWVARLNE